MEKKETEYTGSFPIRQDITVLEPRPEDKLRLPFNFVIFEGDVILKKRRDFVKATKRNTRNSKHFEHIIGGKKDYYLRAKRLKNFDDIQEDDIVYSTWYDYSIVAMKVEGIDTEKQTARGKLNEHWFGSLAFNKDSRNCWVCNGYCGMTSPHCIAKVTLEDELESVSNECNE